jgi:hypothetical protein
VREREEEAAWARKVRREEWCGEPGGMVGRGDGGWREEEGCEAVGEAAAAAW